MGLNSASAEMTRVVDSLLQKHGGVGGLIRQFDKEGLGSIARAWAKGEGHPVTADQLYRALGYETLQQLGTKLGMAPNQVAATLADLLPKSFARATTPNWAAQGRFPWTGAKRTLQAL